MKRIGVAVAIDVLIAAAAHAQLMTGVSQSNSGGSATPPPASTISLVANRGRVLTDNSASFSYANGRTFFYARGTTISKIGVILPCWYSSNGENSSGGPITWQGWIEYPAGVDDGDFKFSGSSSGSCNNSNLTSDLLTLNTPIPQNAQAWFRPFEDAHLATSGILFGLPNLAFGTDAVNASSSVLSPLVAPNNPTATGGLGPITPVAFFGPTASASVALIGDSRTIGIADTEDASGDSGEAERTYGATTAYTNLGSSGETAFFASGVPFAGTPTFNLRRVVAPYVTNVDSLYGINDLLTNQTLANVEAAEQACWFMLGQYVTARFQNTLSPVASSSNAFADTANQAPPTAYAGNALFTPLGPGNVYDQNNTFLKTVPVGLKATFDTANTIEFGGANGGRWIASPSPPYTGDGVHGFQNAMLVIKNSGVIDPTKLVAPVANPAYVGPGDIVSYLTWWGLRAISAAKAGLAVVNVCLPSDTACADFLTSATTGALIPTAAGVTTCSNTIVCTVKTFYDQAGAFPLTQATIANRGSLLFNTVTGLPYLSCAGSCNYQSATFLAQSQPFTVSMAAARTGNFASLAWMFDNSFGSAALGWGSAANQLFMYVSASVPEASQIDGNFHSVQAVYNNTIGTASVDGAAPVTMNLGGTNGLGNGTFALMSRVGGSNGSTAKFYELGISAGAMSSPNQNLIAVSDRAFWQF